MVTIGDKDVKIPDNLLYSDKHQWVNDAGEIGLSDFAQASLGEIITCDLAEDDYKGKEIKAGDLFEDISVEAQKAVADVYCPVSGKIVAVNIDLEDEPEKINEDAYSAWLFKLEVSDKSGLMDATAYIEFCKSQ
ncbi:MAG: glycine cleavage system protein H [archaeon]|nr:glycine cleavage system protein H [archaeon]